MFRSLVRLQKAAGSRRAISFLGTSSHAQVIGIAARSTSTLLALNSTLTQANQSKQHQQAVAVQVRYQSTTSDSSAAAEQQPLDQPQPTVYPVYVHHVSKVVLQHLQDHHAEWLMQNGLERGLRLNSNGTFVLQFPTTKGMVNPGRIWTSYDSASRQHWLSIYRRKLVGRFLLKEQPTTVYPTRNKLTVEATIAEDFRKISLVVDTLVQTYNEAEQAVTAANKN